MKKKAGFFTLGRNIFILVVVILFASYLFHYLQKEKIIAHPSNDIILNNGTAEKFVVPKDTPLQGKNVEGGILPPLYQNYWQNKFTANGIKKLNLDSISTQYQERMFEMKRTQNGFNVFLIGRINNNNAQKSGFWINVFDDNGKLTDTIEPIVYRKNKTLGKSTNPNNVNPATYTGNTSASGIFEVINNSVKLVYSSTDYVPIGQSVEKLKEINFTIDAKGKIIPTTYKDENIKRNTPSDIFWNIRDIFSSSKLYNTNDYVSLSTSTTQPASGSYNGPYSMNYVINTFSIHPTTKNFKWNLKNKEVILKFKEKAYREYSPYSKVVKLTGANKKVYYLISLYAGESINNSNVTCYLFNENGSYAGESIMFDVKFKDCQYQLLPELTTATKAYYIGYDMSGVKPTTLFSVDVSGASPVFKAEKTWSPGLYLNLSYSHTTGGKKYYNYFSYTSKPVAEFKGYDLGVFYGLLDNNFEIISKQYSRITDGQGISVNNLITTPDKYIVSGITNSRTFSNAPSYGWQNKLEPEFNTGNAYYGIFLKSNDFSPLINFKSGLFQDINLSNKNLNVENELLKDVQVYDSYDLDKNGANLDINYLNKRINRNPKTIKNGVYDKINWTALGYKFNKIGPNNVTYFITDSTENVTSKSKMVHNITDATVKNTNVYFDAQNFSVPLSSVKTAIPDQNTFKFLAETAVWDGISAAIYEDGKNKSFSPKVTANAQQLKALQNATVAKPYPVDLTANIANSQGVQVKVTNRVWVFVTTKNTKVDKNTSMVIYADDYRLPLYSAKNETKNKIYQNTKVKVYDFYDNKNETANVLPTIADSTKITGLNILNPQVINAAQTPGKVRPTISYTWAKGTSSTTADVTLYIDILLHTRQIILKNSPVLPVPKEGYLKLNYGKNEPRISLPSASENNGSVYANSRVIFEPLAGVKELNFTLIPSEYYNYKGYVVSTTNIPHSSAKMVKQPYKHTIGKDSYELWITFYIESTNQNSVKLYSWDYKKSDFGRVKMKK